MRLLLSGRALGAAGLDRANYPKKEVTGGQPHRHHPRRVRSAVVDADEDTGVDRGTEWDPPARWLPSTNTKWGAMATEITPGALRTPRAAAFAGIAFAVLFAIIVVLIHEAVPSSPRDAGAWLTNPGRRGNVQVALALVPFCGIFFLWFMGALRSRIHGAEEKFFATLFLGSGLLFVAMLFVLAAVFGGLITIASLHDGRPPLAVWQLGRTTTYNLTTIYAMRMAAVFTISASTIAWRLGLHHRVIAWIGYLVGLLLLVAGTAVPWIEIVFPVWVLLVSVNILTLTYRRPLPAIDGDGPLASAED